MSSAENPAPRPPAAPAPVTWRDMKSAVKGEAERADIWRKKLAADLDAPGVSAIERNTILEAMATLERRAETFAAIWRALRYLSIDERLRERLRALVASERGYDEADQVHYD